MKRLHFNRAEHLKELKRFDVASKAFAVDVTENNVKGYAAVWDVMGSQPGEICIFPTGSCVYPDYPVTLQYNHSDDYILATEDNQTLSLDIDEHGLSMTATLDNTFIEQYVLTKLAKGTIRGMSLGMFPLKGHTEKRTITEADAEGNLDLIQYVGQEKVVNIYDEWLLDEVTICGRPVFPQTNVESFSRKTEDKNKSKLDRYLKEGQLMALLLRD